MSNLAHKPLVEPSSNIFCGEWIARLDSIAHRSFIEEADEKFISKFSSHAYERGISGIELSNVTNTALGFIEKKRLKPLNIEYLYESMYGGLSVSFVIPCSDNECDVYYHQMVNEIVTRHEDFMSDLITFDFTSYENHSDASQAA